jgi:DNA polymerase III delta subunit
MIIFLYGEDTFQGRRKIKELKEKFIREVDPSGSSLEVIDGAMVKIEQINEKISPSSLLSKKRMIVIENTFASKNKKITEEFLELLKNKKNAVEANIVIIWEPNLRIKKTGLRENLEFVDASGKGRKLTKAENLLYVFLNKQKFVQEFKNLSNLEAANWVKNEIANKGGDITQRAAQTLVSLVGNNLWQLENEANKLVNYKLGREPKLTEGGKPAPVEDEDVEKLVRGKFDENIFALTDALANRNKALAIKLLESEFEAGLTDAYLISMIMRQFKILLQVKAALDNGWTSRKIISSLGLHAFVAQKSINQVRNFTAPALKGIVNQLIKIDFAMKTGQAEARMMLDLLIAKI